MNTLTREDWELISEALNEYSQTIVDIDDERNYTMEDLEAIFEKSRRVNALSGKLEIMTPTDRTKIIVCVNGGVVTGAYSTDKSGTTDVVVWDWDDKIESEEYVETDLSDAFDDLTKDMQLIY